MFTPDDNPEQTPGTPGGPGGSGGAGGLGGSGGPGGPGGSGAFGASSGQVDLLDAAVHALHGIELQARAVEAARLLALAKIRAVAAAEAETLDRAGRETVEQSLAYRSAVADAATAMHLTERSLQGQIEQAHELTSRYAATVAALAAGIISRQHAIIISDAGHIIGRVGEPDTDEIRTQRAEYEARVLDCAARETPARLRPYAKRVAEEYAAVTLDERFAHEQQFRRVWCTERDNGMAEVGAYLPAHEALGIHSRLTLMAKRVEQVEAAEREAARKQAARQGARQDAGQDAGQGAAQGTGQGGHAPRGPGAKLPGDPGAVRRRSRDEIRAGLFADLLLNGTGDTATGDGAALRGIVQVITHATDLENTAADRPGSSEHRGMPATRTPLPTLEGYGPLPVDVARTIAGSADSWLTVGITPDTGTVVTVDTYRPSAAQKRWLTVRDQHCRFPGCRVAAHRCDIDHTIDAALDGPTSTDNLGMLCRGHHLLKHHGGWTATQHPNADYEWTSPTGRTHLDRPVSRVRFGPPGDPTDDPGGGPGDDPGGGPTDGPGEDPGGGPTDGPGGGRGEDPGGGPPDDPPLSPPDAPRAVLQVTGDYPHPF